MKQPELDHHLRNAIQTDDNIQFALTYGSFTQGSGDQFSDLEYYLYIPEPEFDVGAWLQGALRGSSFRVLHATVNEFGTPNFIVTGLIRLEVHAHHPRHLPDLLGWPSEHIHPDAMLVKDEGGRLLTLLRELAARPGPDPSQEAQRLLDQALNWLVFGQSVLRRGERLRAGELLWWIRGKILHLARLKHGATGHWLSPARLAEWELPGEALLRYGCLFTDLDGLEGAYREAARWLLELADELNLVIDQELKEALTVRG